MEGTVKQLEDVDPQYLLECVTGDVLTAVFGVTRRTLANWRKSCDLPSLKIGNRRVYHFPSVRKWALTPGTLLQALGDTPDSEKHL